MTVLKKMDGSRPIEVSRACQRSVLSQMPAVIERLQRGERVPHIRVLVLRAVAYPAVEEVVGLTWFPKIRLQPNQELARLPNNRLVLRLVCGQQGHHAKGGVVGDEVRLEDASVRFRAAEDKCVSTGHPVHLPGFRSKRGITLRRRKSQRRDRRLIGSRPVAVCVLIFPKPEDSPIDGALHFVAKRNVRLAQRDRRRSRKITAHSAGGDQQAKKQMTDSHSL